MQCKEFVSLFPGQLVGGDRVAKYGQVRNHDCDFWQWQQIFLLSKVSTLTLGLT